MAYRCGNGQRFAASDAVNLFIIIYLGEELFVKDPVTPHGTIALLVLFILLTVGLWFNAYFIVLSRGVTQ